MMTYLKIYVYKIEFCTLQRENPRHYELQRNKLDFLARIDSFRQMPFYFLLITFMHPINILHTKKEFFLCPQKCSFIGS